MNTESYYLSDMIDVIREVLDSGGEFQLAPRGTSMLPLILEGRDAVTLASPSQTAKRLDIVLYQRDNGQYVLHRILKIEKDLSLTMCGDNQLVLERGIRGDQIIGRVVKLHRKGRDIPVKALRYRLYSILHGILWLRRIIFFFTRRVPSGMKRICRIMSKRP